MKIIFISHTFPPITGGIESQNYELSVWLSKIAEVKTIANTRGRYFLPFFAPYALLRTLLLLPKYDVVLLGSGVLAIVGWIVKLFSKKPVVSVIHGLDINYDSSSLGVWYEKILIVLYQKFWIGIFLKKIDKFIAVGNETVRIAVRAGLEAKKIVFVPNGIDPQKFIKDYNCSYLASVLNEDISDKKFILTSGRLAKRKGVAWFIRNVLPKLPENVIYIVAGNGPDKKNIEQAVKDTSLEKRVRLLGYVSDETRDILLNTCDVFVQPNIKVPGDMEGFGISVIEAVSCKIPLIASNLEGLKDAIKDGQNGFLVETENTEGYAQKISELLADENYCREFGEKARKFVVENYSWEKISKRYLEEINKVVNLK